MLHPARAVFNRKMRAQETKAESLSIFSFVKTFSFLKSSVLATSIEFANEVEQSLKRNYFENFRASELICCNLFGH
jgi:hypothetical protein